MLEPIKTVLEVETENLQAQKDKIAEDIARREQEIKDLQHKQIIVNAQAEYATTLFKRLINQARAIEQRAAKVPQTHRPATISTRAGSPVPSSNSNGSPGKTGTNG